jgi:HAD superfamily hydrolase (TIGR01549 family)
MKNKDIKDVFFDLDHTLWDFDKNSELTFETIFNKNHPTIETKEFIEKYVPINQACWKLYQYDKISHDELRYNRLKHSFDAIVLDYLDQKYKLHIITNGFAEVQYKKLTNSNIGNYFQTITNSEMAGVKKPNPVIFEYALDLAKAKKESSIMIGDCLEADVQGALDAGLDAIFFNGSNVKVEENIKQVNHLLELKKYL